MSETQLPSLSIEYCLECCETLRALHEAEGILVRFEDRLKQLVLIPGDNGVFEVTLGERLIFSKKRTGRHPKEDELVELVGAELAEKTGSDAGRQSSGVY